MSGEDLIEKLRAALDADESAIAAYVAHRAGGEHVNYPGQNPADYDEHDSCSRCIETAKACRYRDPNDGRRMVAAHRKILDEHEENCATYNDPLRTEPMALSPTLGLWWALVAIAKGYGIEVEQ